MAKVVKSHTTDDGTVIDEMSDGSFSLPPNDFFRTPRINGIPTLALAKQIIEALWGAEQAGADHYAGSER
jgi:hypothetical protein